MTLAVQEKPTSSTGKLTIEEFDRLPNPKNYELVHGERVERAMGTESNLIATAIASILFLFNVRHRLGHVLTENDYLLDPDDPDHFRRPDASFVSISKFP